MIRVVLVLPACLHTVGQLGWFFCSVSAGLRMHSILQDFFFMFVVINELHAYLKFSLVAGGYEYCFAP